ncbi:hypothetical protein QMK33_01290 [Hymenobacter sp. H14-R3]|uniref:hypothetical protein n=1 Tax=Hymenobacter sp. H14-R3 TaxID=3046308 RepID=UPI0024BB81CA|nr:hypothetical protein [Hymenobacter sp. H14-R3]MDJ0363768.1 hypothetical protein [Hymenobacter sp. H14-R3]
MSFLSSSSGKSIHWLTTAFVATNLSLASHAGLAQQVAPATIRLLPEDEGRGQYGHQHNFYFLPPGKMGEEYQSAGFFGGKLRPYLAGHPQALKELDNYKRQKTTYLADRVLLVGSLGLYASQVFSNGDPVYFNGTQQVAAGAAVVSLLATIFINRHTNEYFKQAVDSYNTDAPRTHGTLWPRLRPTGVGVAAASGRPVLALRWQF